MKLLIAILVVVLVAALDGWEWTLTLPIANAAAPSVAESTTVDGVVVMTADCRWC